MTVVAMVVVVGVAYNHVFPIEIEQADGGVRKLEIGYNNDQNPFQAAQDFIVSHHHNTMPTWSRSKFHTRPRRPAHLLELTNFGTHYTITSTNDSTTT